METPFHFHIENRAKKLTVLLHFSNKCCLASSVPSLQEGCSLSPVRIVRGRLAEGRLWDTALTQGTQKPEDMSSQRRPDLPQPAETSAQSLCQRGMPTRTFSLRGPFSSGSLSGWPSPSFPTQLMFLPQCFFQQFLILFEEIEVEWETDTNSDFEGLR